MQEIARVSSDSPTSSVLHMHLVAAANQSAAAAAAAATSPQATISLTAAAPRGSRGSSRGSSGEESSDVLTTHSSGSGSEEGGSSSTPMDLSSGGASVAATSAAPSTPLLRPSLEDHPLWNARKLAEFVKAQHFAQQQKENETTPPSAAALASLPSPPNTGESKLPKKRPWAIDVDGISSTIRERLLAEENSRSLSLAQSHSPPESCGDNQSSTGSAHSSSTPTQGREVKKRRLDELLNKKFSVSPPSSSPSPPQHHREEGQEKAIMERRPSNERKSNNNRRKQNSSSSNVKPPSSLFPPLTSLRPNSPPTSSQSAENDVLRSQLLQLQLAQAALLSNAQQPDLFKSSPLLYYGYYAQMMQGLQQLQQNKLVEHYKNGTATSSASTTSTKSAEDIVKSLLKRENGFKLPTSPVKEERCKTEVSRKVKVAKK